LAGVFAPSALNQNDARDRAFAFLKGSCRRGIYDNMIFSIVALRRFESGSAASAFTASCKRWY
jgi:hypothetical protein